MTDSTNGMGQSELPNSVFELLQDLRRKGVDPAFYKREISKFLDFRARIAGIPLRGQFMLTPLCNLNCKMCNVHLSREQMNERDVLPDEVFKRIITDACKSGMMKATLTGGECLTYPGFDGVYEHLLNNGVEVTVKTNGFLLDEQRIEYFSKLRPAGIMVTLYGASEDGYERVAERRVFGKIHENLLKAKKAGLPLAVSITPSCFMRDARETICLVRDMGIPFSVNSYLVDPEIETGRRGRKIDLEMDEYIDLLTFVEELDGKRCVPKDIADSPSPEMSFDVSKGLSCAAGRSAFEVDWQGVLRGCSALTRLPAVDLTKVGFETAWNEVNSAAREYISPMCCDGCPYFEGCIHCPGYLEQKLAAGCARESLCERGKRLYAAGLLQC